MEKEEEAASSIMATTPTPSSPIPTPSPSHFTSFGPPPFPHVTPGAAPSTPTTSVAVFNFLGRLVIALVIVYVVSIWHSLESSKLSVQLAESSKVVRAGTGPMEGQTTCPLEVQCPVFPNVDCDTGPSPRADSLSVAVRPRTDKRAFRVFVVTFRAHAAATKVVEELLRSDLTDFTFEISVINNWGTFAFPLDNPLFAAHAGNLTVINNYGRPEWSWGHLSRDWNVAALYGFKNLADPNSEVVVGVQGDASIAPQWAHAIYDEHTKNGMIFISAGRGDAFHSWTAEGVRKLGLWDEHYCDIGFQEEDMFLRAVILEPTRVRISDFAHRRTHNPFPVNPVAGDGDHDREGHPVEHWHSELYHATKWPEWNAKMSGWWANTTDLSLRPRISTYYSYPYFEWRLEGLKDRLGYPYEVDPDKRRGG
jgi:hypothetical protein